MKATYAFQSACERYFKVPFSVVELNSSVNRTASAFKMGRKSDGFDIFMYSHLIRIFMRDYVYASPQRGRRDRFVESQ